MPRVVEVPVPNSSNLLCTLKDIYFCDAYQVALSQPQLSVQDAYEAVFGHVPRWVNTLMAVRGMAATALGLKHETNAGFQHMLGSAESASYQVGQRVGLFRVQSIEANELIVGDNDKHLDFRISIYKSSMHGDATVTISTAVEIHNTTGRLYMLVVKPFHRFIARLMVQRAANAGRL